MQLNPDRPRIAALRQTPIGDVLTAEQIQRMGAVEAAFVICGGVSDEEVFTSDVLDVAAFIFGPERDEPATPTYTGPYSKTCAPDEDDEIAAEIDAASAAADSETEAEARLRRDIKSGN